MALPSLWRWGRDPGELARSRDLWDPFAGFRRDLERLFEDLPRDLGWGAPLAAGGPAPRLDVSETDSGIRIEAELPGVDAKDVELVLSERRLTIKGEKKQDREEKKQDFHLVERSYGSFARSIALPFEVEPSQVQARFANGVLTVTLPKPPEVKAKEQKIPISSS
jgi:HSP20 family protein